jgi:hypothetical protein
MRIGVAVAQVTCSAAKATTIRRGATHGFLTGSCDRPGPGWRDRGDTALRDREEPLQQASSPETYSSEAMTPQEGLMPPFEELWVKTAATASERLVAQGITIHEGGVGA